MSTAIGAGISGVFGEKPGSGVSAYDNIYSVHFDSPAQRINCGDSSSFSFPGTVASDRAFSISTWVYFVDTVNSVQICGKGDVGTADAEYNLETDSAGRVRIRLYDSNVSSTSTSYWQGRNNTNLETNKWYHIVATFDGTTPNAQSNSIRIYVNNQLNNVVTRVNTPGPFVQMFDNGGKFILGTTDGVNSKNIYMDEAAIFNRALTQADINYLYSIPFTPNLTVNGNFTELGSELILNGDFEELGDNGVDYPSDVASFTEPFELDVATNLYTYNKSLSGSGRINFGTSIAAEVGQTYKIVIDITISSGNANVAFKSGNSQTTIFNFTDLSNGVNTFYSTVTGVDGDVNRFFVSSGATDNSFTLNSISVQQVDPNDRWTLGTGWSIEDGKASYDNSGTASLTQSFTWENGKTYEIQFEVSDFTSNYRFDLYSGSSFIQSAIVTDKTTWKIYFVGDGGTTMRFRALTTGAFSLDNVSVKEISDWTFGDGWSVNSSNQAEYDGTGTTASALEQTVATYEDGKKYQVQFQLDGSLNGVAVSINGGTAVNALRSTTDNSSRSVTVIAGSGSNSLKITPLGATDTFTISDITSKLVTSLAAPNTDKDDARAIDLTGMSDLDHWWRMGDTQGPATYPVIHDVVYNPFGEQLVENGNFDELGPQLIQNPYFNLGTELVTNGDFATDSDWVKSGSWTYDSSNQSYKTTSSSISSLKQNGVTQINKTYKLTFNVTSAPNGFSDFRVINSDWSETYVNPNEAQLGENTFYINVVNGTGIRFRVQNLYEIDNVSVKEVPYWSLTQATITNGAASFATTDGSFAAIRQNVFTPGKTYLISLDVDDLVGTAEVNTNGGTSIGLEITTNGSKSFYMKAENTDIEIKRKFGVTNTSATISNIVVKQVDPEGEWNLSIGNPTIEEGVAIFPDSTSSYFIQVNVADLTVKNYKLTYEVVSTNGNNFRLAGGNSAFGTVTLDSATIGKKTAYLTSNGTVKSLQFNNNAFIGSFTNVSIQQVSDTSGIMENMKPDNIVAFSPPDPDPLVGDEFIFSVNTAYTGTGVSNADQFQLPLISAGTLDFTVIWGDGTQDIITSYNQAETLHTYPSSGTYTIGIRANTQPLKGFKFDGVGDRRKMSNIVNWGGSNFNLDQQEAFYGCSNMTCTATDAPVITTTVFYRMFRACDNFNGDLSNWDVSGVASLAQVFFGCLAFTGKGLENWDISSANRIDYMFFNCSVFNGQIGGWDTSGVSNMKYTFQLCSIFNQDISSWNTSLVTQMTSMFQEAYEFNQPLNSWDVSSCTSFASMFKNAPEFNQPLNNWTIKNDAEIDMNAMFFNANAFNQDVSMWDVSRVRFMQYMFYSCRDMSFGFDSWDTSSVDNFFRFAGDTNFLDTSFGYFDMSSAIDIGLFKDGGQTISTENYNNTLIGWAAQTVNPDLTTSFGNATYSYSAFDARNTLTSAPNNWTITDGGYVPTDNAFQFTVNPNLQTLGNQLVPSIVTIENNNGAVANHISENIYSSTSDGTASSTIRPKFDFNTTGGKTYKLVITPTGTITGTVDFDFYDGSSYLFQNYDFTTTKEIYFTDNGGVFGAFDGTQTYSISSFTISIKEVLSDTNQFELPLINSGTQDFVVDWGDGEQDKITAWDDTAKLHSYYTYGSELVTNGDFANWTGDNPDNYLVLNEDANNYVTESNGQLRMVSDNSATIAIRPEPTTMLSSDSTYRVSVDLTFTTGTLNISGVEFNTSGTKVFYLTPPSTYLQLAKGSALDVLIDNLSIVEQTPDTTPKTISIDGTIQGWQFNAPGDYLKLNNINRWGALELQRNAMFFRCAAMTCTATDAPVITTTNFYRMFRGCTNFNGAIGNWDVSRVREMSQSLMYCPNFNQPLNDWDVSSVNNFTQMFHGATNFNQSLNEWQINNSEIVTMYAMFYDCPNFNGDIYSWDTSTVWNMKLMLFNCDSFDQSLAAWNIEGVTDFGDISGNGFMRSANGLSASNYNLTLVSWAHQNVNSGLAVDFGGSQYSAGGAAAASRNILTSAPNNWAISDGGSV